MDISQDPHAARNARDRVAGHAPRSTAPYLRRVAARASLLTASAALLLSLSAWISGTVNAEGSLFFGYISVFVIACIVPLGLIIIAWVFFIFGTKRDARGFTKTAAASLALLISQTIVYGFIGAAGLTLNALILDSLRH